MDTTEQFRLEQKIEEDVLGEVYCAAWSGEAEADDEMMLVRLFERDGLDAERFLERTQSRQQLVGAELGDQVISSKLLGVANGRAFDLFPYVSGRSLAGLIEVATRQRETFPLEVALYVVGRLATGLGVAFRQEIEGECLVHGFVVPHLVRVSEEGGVSLGGLEAAPALHELQGTAATFAQLLPYLSPERRAGKPLHPADDVYSLGALLYQLLTLRPLGSPSDLRIESQAIPSELRYFLARSVAERSRRIQSVVEWLRELKALVVQERWTASREDLSGFLAEVDERVRPFKPDTSQITAADREEFARLILEARAEKAAEELEEASSAEDPGEDEEAVEQASVSDSAEVSDSVEASSESEAEASSEETEEDSPARGRSYETSVITRKDLEPLIAEGRLVKTSHVKRASDSPLML